MNKRQKKKNDKKARLESEKAAVDFKEHVSKKLDVIENNISKELDSNINTMGEAMKATQDSLKEVFNNQVDTEPKKVSWLKRLLKKK